MRAGLVVDALAIHHSDQGSQYTSIEFTKRCESAGVRPSMGSVGDCYDNAMRESFNATSECELRSDVSSYWGYLVRGAVTFGALIHDKRYLLGPALVKAHLMESQEAIYPRVLIDPKVIEIGRKHRIDINSADDEEDYIGSFLAKDADRKFFIDYISFDRVVDACGTDVESYGEYLRRIGSITEKMLMHDKPGIREKGEWLHKPACTRCTSINRCVVIR